MSDDCKLEPLFARVILRREKMTNQSGIIIPESAAKRNAPTIGVLIAKGPTAEDDLELGSTYLFGQHAGSWVNERGVATLNDNENEFYVCQDEDLIARVA